MSAWTDLVKKTYNENKHKKGYKLGHAMKSAKKIYKTMKKSSGKNRGTKRMRGGNKHNIVTPIPM